ncbi:nicotianamine synthase [Dorcoceras hygrometricum]|uniref:Nicotianamine synthase n=1 Tax=Dorcoceras hygrometricum TaxID=472368 RepID=A0A2Z7BFH1_9LAMI|nr:nicotianamine synthase [Dorcoceras hygrometricum]
MPTFTRSCDQQPLRATVLPAPATTAEALPDGPPPGPDGSNVTNLCSNRGLTRENWSLQVDAPAMLRRRDHLLVFAFVLPTPATTNRGLTRENWSLQVDAPAMLRRRDHLLVFAFVLPTPATNARSLQSGPPPDPDGSNMTDLTSNHGPNMENKPLQVDTPAQRRDAPLTTSTA